MAEPSFGTHGRQFIFIETRSGGKAADVGTHPNRNMAIQAALAKKNCSAHHISKNAIGQTDILRMNGKGKFAICERGHETSREITHRNIGGVCHIGISKPIE